MLRSILRRRPRRRCRTRHFPCRSSRLRTDGADRQDACCAGHRHDQDLHVDPVCACRTGVDHQGFRHGHDPENAGGSGWRHDRPCQLRGTDSVADGDDHSALLRHRDDRRIGALAARDLRGAGPGLPALPACRRNRVAADADLDLRCPARAGLAGHDPLHEQRLLDGVPDNRRRARAGARPQDISSEFGPPCAAAPGSGRRSCQPDHRCARPGQRVRDDTAASGSVCFSALRRPGSRCPGHLSDPRDPGRRLDRHGTGTRRTGDRHRHLGRPRCVGTGGTAHRPRCWGRT